MAVSVKSPNALFQTLALATSPRLAGSLTSTLTVWIKSNGPSWTVARLKAIYQATIQLRAGNRDKTVSLYQEYSISYDRQTLIPKGPFGVVVRGAINTKKDVVFRRMIGVLRCYTFWTAPKVAEEVWDKHRHSIKSPSTAKGTYPIERAMRDHCERYAARVKPERRPVLTDFKSSKGIHIPERKERPKTDAPFARHIVSLLTTTGPPDTPFILDGWKCFNLAELHLKVAKDVVVNDTGHISILTDRGMKTRAVAVPNFWYQFVFKALHEQLDSLAKSHPASCAHSQNDGAFALETLLLRGEAVYCFDLSSATDRFPLGLQTAALEGLGLGQWSPRLREATRGWNMNGSRTFWSVGQPMGLYGSFPLFHLTHIYLLEMLCEREGVDPAGTFLVLGDDVIISNGNVAKAYQQMMQQLGVEISTSKSVVSRSVGEFAGFLACKLRPEKVSVFRPYKWGGKVSRQSWVALAHFLARPLGSLDKRLSRVFEEYELARSSGFLYPDLSPLIPTDDPGGIPGRSVDATRLVNIVGRYVEGSGVVTSSNAAEEIAFELLGLVSPGRIQLEPERHYPTNRKPLTVDGGQDEKSIPTIDTLVNKVQPRPISRQLNDISELERSTVFTPKG